MIRTTHKVRKGYMHIMYCGLLRFYHFEFQYLYVCMSYTQHRKGTFLVYSTVVFFLFFLEKYFFFFLFFILYTLHIKFFCTPSSDTTSSTTVDSPSDLSSVGTQSSHQQVATTSNKTSLFVEI